jgi:hypothetical protein
VRVRGLKHGRDVCRTGVRGLKLPGSHPVRVRGLKHDDEVTPDPENVAPRAGAWVETLDELILADT